MKKTFVITLTTLGMLAAACSSESADEETKNATSEKKETTADTPEKPEVMGSDEHSEEPKAEVVEKVDDKGNVVRVVKNKETGEEISLEDKSEEEIAKIIETIEAPKEVEDDSEPDFNIHDYTKLNTFLGKYVTSDGHVKYSSIKSNRSELDAIIAEFKASPPEDSWSRNQKLAFWINTYNIFTIKLIVDNYPTSSITKIASKPWEKKIVTIGDKTHSLDHVENGIIRKQFSEPRIHFALNCASESCPILLNRAYKAGSLDSQLTSQTKKFLNDTSKNSFSKKEAKISKIFDWYKADFPDVMGFIKKYHPLDYTPKNISYMEYSWDLNK